MSNDNRKNAQHGRDNYPVGYGRPPADHKFKPGRSGNPNGRPRKDKAQQQSGAQWGMSTLAAGKALYERVKVTRNGKTTEMSLIEAIHHRRAADALKGGNRLLQREVIAEANAYEQKILDAEVRHYYDMCKKKAEGQKLIADARSEGLPEPELLPHPDDIVLDHDDRTAWVDGPTNQHQLDLQSFIVRLRDYIVLRSVYEQRFPSLLQPPNPDRHKWLEPMAEAVNDGLNRRLAWGQHGFWRATQPLLRLGVRALEKKLQAALTEIETRWNRDPALEDARQDKYLRKVMQELLEFSTRSRERRIWQLKYAELRAVLSVILGPDNIAHMPEHGILKSYEDSIAAYNEVKASSPPEEFAKAESWSKEIMDLLR